MYNNFVRQSVTFLCYIIEAEVLSYVLTHL